MSIDRHDVRKGREIEFSDGVVRLIKPLSIKQLRKFVKVIDKLGDSATDATQMSDEDIDTMVDAAEIILAKVDPGLAGNRDLLEDTVDLVTFGEMMEVAMGNTSPEE